MSTLLPQPFWFRVAHSCRRVNTLPRVKGRLLDLGPEHALVDLGQLAGPASWVRVRSAWNLSGIGFSFEVVDKIGKISPRPHLPGGQDQVQIWLDTRDTRTVHRATKFCHKYTIRLTGSGANLAPDISQQAIARALANPPMRLHEVETRAERTATGWLLEVWFGSEALNGFNPAENRRFGLTYQVTDPNRGDHFAGVGREFPVGDDPSLWATLVLDD